MWNWLVRTEAPEENDDEDRRKTDKPFFKPAASFAAVSELIMRIGFFADAQSLGRMKQVNTRFHEAIANDEVWAVHCKFNQHRRPPYPFPSNETYYRVFHAQDGGAQTSIFGSLPTGASRSGSMIRGGDNCEVRLPVIQLCTKKKRVDILLLDRAEHIFVGCTNTNVTSVTTLEGPGCSFNVIPWVFPGVAVTLAMEDDRFRVYRYDDDHNPTIAVDQPLGNKTTFAIAIGANRGSFVVLTTP